MADEFEARHMLDDAPVVHRDKRVSRLLALALAIPGLATMALGVFLGFANATASKPVPAAALPFVVAAILGLGLALMTLGVIFAVVRTVVTAREVHVKYGLWGPRIPLSALRSATVVKYDWLEFGGWGIRRSAKGTWAYVPTGDRAVELVFEEGGVEKRVLVGVDDPTETVRQIGRARDAISPGRLRVAEDDAVAEEAEATEGTVEEKKRSS